MVTNLVAQRAVAAAAIVDGTGEAMRLEPIQVPKLSNDRLLEVVADLGVIPGGVPVRFTNHVTLTAQKPWVDGKGYLNAINLRSFYADGPGMHFIPEAGQPTGHLEVG